MSNFQSFAEALEKKIRQELAEEFGSTMGSAEASQEVADETGYQHLAWLMGQTQAQKKSVSYQSSTYSRFTKPPKPRPAHQMSASQQHAYLLLKSYAADLAPNFSNSDLKRAYRQALLKVHPDQGGQAQDFWKVRDAFADLKSLFTAKA